MRCNDSQSGMALALVLWMLTALTVLVAGLVAISREGTGSIDAKVISAMAFYLGKGAARLAMRDRAYDRSGDWDSDGSDDALRAERIYTAQYEFDGASVTARVYPSTGFMLMPTEPSESWVTFLNRVGGLDPALASQVVNRFDTYFEENEVVGGGSEPDMSTFDGYRAAYTDGNLGVGGDIAYVEALLGVEGMTREAYERIRRSVAPVRGSAPPDPALSPPELKNIFRGDPEATAGKQNPNTRYFCVELLMDFDGAQQVSQRIWVAGQGAMQGQTKLVRVGRPVFVNRVNVG